MVPADVLFRLTANAAAAQYQQAPPFLAYRTTAHIVVTALNRQKTVDRAVETRTADDFAVLQDLPKGQRQYGHSFPLIPTFDAISYFKLEYEAQRDVLAHVTMYAPITFGGVQKSDPNTTVVALSLRNYYATYADDSTPELAHIDLQPLRALTEHNTSDFYLHDIVVDTATNLPTRVTYTGHDDLTFTLEYKIVEHHWLISRAFYQRAYFAPLHLGRTTVSVDATFTDFTFPAQPEDPQLRGTPAPTEPPQYYGLPAPPSPAPQPVLTPAPSPVAPPALGASPSPQAHPTL